MSYELYYVGSAGHVSAATIERYIKNKEKEPS